MILELIKYFALGFFACTIAALPFGLVNLSVIDTAIKYSKYQARLISIGASGIEIIFVTVSLLFGHTLKDFFIENIHVKIIVFVVLTGAAIHFYFRKNKMKTVKQRFQLFFMKGMFLNAISIQVLSFWLIAVLYFFSEQWISFNIWLIFFVLGTFTGKMLTLEFYIWLTQRLKKKISSLPKYTNKLMFIIFSVLSIIQLIRFFFSFRFC